MGQIEIYHVLVTILLLTAPIVFFILLMIPAPYGRHARSGYGPMLPSRLGWLLMEGPAALVMPYFFYLNKPHEFVPYVFLLLWEMHYINRGFIFPLRFANPNKPLPFIVPALGIFFIMTNSSVNGISLTLVHTYEMNWLVDPRFIIGCFLFISGFLINQSADATLRDLRQSGSSGYQIPQGKLYYWVSCPNYLGEIIEWTGWAIATWSIAGFAFMLWTIANLVPRGITHHQWYMNAFKDYPKNRYAIIPGIL